MSWARFSVAVVVAVAVALCAGAAAATELQDTAVTTTPPSLLPGRLEGVELAGWDAAEAERAGVSLPGQITMQRTLFANADARNATCNDGTAAGYYVWRPETPSNDWIIYLEGGGLCYDLETCLKRPKILTSSTPWPQTLGMAGLFSNLTSNQYRTFNKVVVIYCTSDLYSGTVPQGSGLLGWSFNGNYLMPALLEDLSKIPSFTAGGRLLFTGGSAGGIGTFVQYPYIKSSVTWKSVRALPDAGWFLTTMAPYSKKAAPLGTMLKEGMAAWRGMPPANCASTLGPESAHLCYSGPVVYNFMPEPESDIFVCKAQTDAWTVGHDGLKSPWTAQEIEWLIEIAAQVRLTFQLDKVVNVFSANCLYHTSLVLLWGLVDVSGTKLGEAVQDWYFGNKTVHLVDSCTTPLCNDSCM